MSDSLLKSIALATAVFAHLLLGIWLSLPTSAVPLESLTTTRDSSEPGDGLVVVFIQPAAHDTAPALPAMPTAPVRRSVRPQPTPKGRTAVVIPPASTGREAAAEEPPADVPVIDREDAAESTFATTNAAAPTEVSPAAAATAPRQGPPLTPDRARREREAWLRELMVWLLRHRVYPDEAKKDKAQGVVRVRFSIDRGGNLLAASIDRGVGHAALDRAALEVLRRASPMPPLPRAISGERLTLTLPIDFSLRTD